MGSVCIPVLPRSGSTVSHRSVDPRARIVRVNRRGPTLRLTNIGFLPPGAAGGIKVPERHGRLDLRTPIPRSHTAGPPDRDIGETSYRVALSPLGPPVPGSPGSEGSEPEMFEVRYPDGKTPGSDFGSDSEEEVKARDAPNASLRAIRSSVLATMARVRPGSVSFKDHESDSDDMYTLGRQTSGRGHLAWSEKHQRTFDRCESFLRSSKKGVSKDFKFLPAPERDSAPALNQTSAPKGFQSMALVWPVSVEDAELPFQTSSKPSPSDLNIIGMSSGKTSIPTSVKDVPIGSRSFRHLETAVSSSVAGAAALRSLFSGFLRVIMSDSPDDENLPRLRDPSSVDGVELAHMIAAMNSSLENSFQNAVHERVQLAALYRDAFLDSSGFTDQEKAELRSLPLERDGLFHPPWLASYLDKRRHRVQEDAFTAIASSRSTGASYSGGSRRNRGVKRQNPYPPSQKSKRQHTGPPSQTRKREDQKTRPSFPRPAYPKSSKPVAHRAGKRV